MSFLITLAILYNQSKSDWEKSLEKRLTVRFKYGGEEIARVENAYLSGESDIRPWAQQLGKQIMGELHFDMNWDDSPAKKEYDDQDGKWIMKYEVVIYLVKNPLELDKGKKSLEDFLKNGSMYEHSVIEGEAGKLPIIWKRKKSDHSQDVKALKYEDKARDDSGTTD
ncbi:MAG: hypothetical protein D6714_19685 [Bacteroidetes bacterium]|nr:MAG: hypothetical protein D6714_19685 [Bacteroidota bacterium]